MLVPCAARRLRLTSALIAKRPKLGQHFLTSDSYRRRIAESLPIRPYDLVIEIGPGQGAMTGLLAERAAQVAAVEVDPDLAAKLTLKFVGTDKVEVMRADVLGVEIGEICRRHDVAAAYVFGNLPYYITSPILHHLLESPERIRGMACVVQLEVAERITARPGTRDYGYLSVLAQLHSVPRIRFRIPPGAFSPPPAVVSALVTFNMVAERPVPDDLRREFLEFARLSFAHKRKTLANNLASRYGTDRVHDQLRALGIKERARAEELGVTELARLFAKLI